MYTLCKCLVSMQNVYIFPPATTNAWHSSFIHTFLNAHNRIINSLITFWCTIGAVAVVALTTTTPLLLLVSHTRAYRANTPKLDASFRALMECVCAFVRRYHRPVTCRQFARPTASQLFESGWANRMCATNKHTHTHTHTIQCIIH